MDALLKARLFEAQAFYKAAEIHTNSCPECLDNLMENTLLRWEHMTGQSADHRGSTTDKATRLGWTEIIRTEKHTDGCDFCLSLQLRSFEERYAHSKERTGAGRRAQMKPPTGGVGR
jgi:hypothetical protein